LIDFRKGRQMELLCQNYERKFKTSRFCTSAVKPWPKIARNVAKWQQFQSFYVRHCWKHR